MTIPAQPNDSQVDALIYYAVNIGFIFAVVLKRDKERS